MQNKAKVKYAKINVSTFVASKYVQVRHLVIQTNKAKQTQFKTKQTQFNKIFERTFGFTTIHCGQNYQKTQKFENKFFLTKG